MERDGAGSAAKDDDDPRIRGGEIVSASSGHMKRQISERNRAEAMADSRDDDDRRLRGGGEIVSDWSRCMRQQIWDCLRDEKISVFSVWGWQGVGKTRIMRQVVAAVMEESRESSRLFDVIIRVRASGVECLAEKMLARIRGELDKLSSLRRRLLMALDAKGRRNRLMEVQMGIKEALEIPKSMHFSAAAKLISAKLSGQRFLLVLEDVWESINLEEMGVPPVMASAITSSSKVVITTRSHEVCKEMGAQVNIMMGEWSKEDAWDFLKEEAANVATSIGFSTTGDMVLKCFSYVSLFCQNGCSIDGDSLIDEYWRSEGFLNGSFNGEENKEAAFKRLGNVLLKELAERCMVLLSLMSSNPDYLHFYLNKYGKYLDSTSKFQTTEDGFMDWLQEQFTMEESSGGRYHVDMNSHVRQVINSQTFLVKYNLDGEEACQWISLSHNQVETFQFSSPNYSLLSTLLLNDNDRMQEIPDSFFKNMTRLRVLDLSSTSISSLP
ncbi:disease resistance protein At4g27190-like [Magnolia sinica]|uniref:disease resistance protein At4g27190-like n=1 Tax=Magnolia sinica TaxID=86752 RepID=UPI0026586A67|nr:disease resistance protein At4g27190-like [Magnolia sinica]